MRTHYTTNKNSPAVHFFLRVAISLISFSLFFWSTFSFTQHHDEYTTKKKKEPTFLNQLATSTYTD